MVKAIDSNSAFPGTPRILSSIIFGCAGSNPAGVVDVFCSSHPWMFLFIYGNEGIGQLRPCLVLAQCMDGEKRCEGVADEPCIRGLSSTLTVLSAVP